MSKLDNFLFYTGITILFLCIFLIFLFFGPKHLTDSENLIFMGNLTTKQIEDLTLNLLKEGDIILTKPKSFFDSYEYKKKIKGYTETRFTSFFFYNLFDKILISSIGDTYWHVGIYVGNKTMNSLYFDTREELINENFIRHKYFKILKVKTSEENKQLAIERANEHYKRQDIYYSLKNGLLTVFLESTDLNKTYNLKENELVCSSYVASIYREVNFNNKPSTHITPVDLEFSDKTEVKFLVNETGVYIKK